VRAEADSGVKQRQAGAIVPDKRDIVLLSTFNQRQENTAGFRDASRERYDRAEETRRQETQGPDNRYLPPLPAASVRLIYVAGADNICVLRYG